MYRSPHPHNKSLKGTIAKPPEHKNSGGFAYPERIRSNEGQYLRCRRPYATTQKRSQVYCSRICLNAQRGEDELLKRTPIVEGEIARVPLSMGRFAIIDECDAKLVSRYLWGTIPSRDGNGYALGHIPGSKKYVLMNRLILGVEDEPDVEVDHKSRNTLDNRRSNLRRATRTENARNKRRRSSSRNKYKGIRYEKREQKWRARICVEGKYINGQYYETEIEAAHEYDRLAHLHHGEFASPNFL